MVRPFVRASTLLIALAMFASCAHTQSDESAAGTPRERGDVDFRIRNNLIPPATVTIYLVPRSGIERELGVLYGSGEQILRYQGMPLQGEYQLVARADLRSLASPIIVLTKVRAMDWDIQRNFVQVTKVDE